MKTCIMTVILGLALTGLIGCQPEPVQCVCQCDGPLPEGAKVRLASTEADKGQKTAPAAAVAAPAKSAPAAAKPAPRPVRNREAARPTARPNKASGPVGAEPGSGTPIKLSDQDKKEMASVLEGFAKAAGAKKIEEMKKWTTERLGNALGRAVTKHTDRLYKRTDIFTQGVKSGMSVGNTNDIGDGNFDIEFKFKDGQTVHVLMFKENNKWRLNRL